MKNYCEKCGTTNEALYEVLLNGELVTMCADCAKSEGLVQCRECGEWVLEGDAIETAYDGGGEFVCESCYEDDYAICEDCGGVYRIEDFQCVNLETSRERMVCDWCANDYSRCEDCGHLYEDAYIREDFNGTVICDDCFDRLDYVICDGCGAIIRGWDSHYSESSGETLCDDCWDEIEESCGLHDYSYKPELDFHFVEDESSDVATYGVELEIDGGDEAALVCHDLTVLDLPIYMKQDSSLSEGEGVEIVTHPCSLAYHEHELDWSAITATAERDGYRSHDTTTCGLHIHVGRRALGGKAANLVLLADALWDELAVFSRRTAGTLEHWAGRPRLNDAMERKGLEDKAALSDDDLSVIALETRAFGRYQGVNLTNYDTVEFRIFRGTLKRDTIVASLQLVDTLVNFARTHTPTECHTATWEDVKALGSHHTELREYMDRRGL